MANNTDIREWGREHAPELFKPKGPPSRKLTEAYYEQHPDATLRDLDFEPEGIADPDLLPVTADSIVDSAEASGTGGGGPAPELPPGTNRARRFRDLFAGKRRKAPKASAKAGPRASTQKLAAGVWGLASRLLNGTGATPLARVLALQGPVAGVIIDREIKGSVVDTMVQPVARMVNRASQVGVLFTLPLLVQIVTVRPELYPQMYPHMVDALYDWYDVAGPEVKKMAEKHRRRREQFNNGEGPTPEEMVAFFFAPPEEQEVPPGEYANTTAAPA